MFLILLVFRWRKFMKHDLIKNTCLGSGKVETQIKIFSFKVRNHFHDTFIQIILQEIHLLKCFLLCLTQV